MEDAKVINTASELKVSLPLTRPTGKVRIKERSFFGEYGKPVAVRKSKMGLSNYVEWQIGYDLEATEENKSKTSLKRWTFTNYKNICKYAYELTEVLYYSVRRRLVSKKQIVAVRRQIETVADSDTLEMRDDMIPGRTNPVPATVNGMDFYRMTVQYPMLVHKFGQYDIYAEVTVREKQRAVGHQAMLYVCLPLTALRFEENAIGRTLNAKETADWVIGREEAELSLELFRIFGMLSPKHRFDVLAIFKMLFP